ncbi:MAG: hypothetical protein AAHH96_02565 [Candidatus Symbiodolus clandestinus]
MISNQKINTVKLKQRRTLKNNRYLKRLLKKLRKKLVRRWQEMPFIRPNQPEGNSGLKNKQHTSPKKIKHRMVSTTEEDKISRVKSFKVRSQCSDLNINQDFITLKKTPPLKNFSALIKPMRIFTLSRLICRLPILTKIFYYSEESIPKTRTRPIVTINTGLSACISEYKDEQYQLINLKFKELKNCIEHLLSIDEETPAQDRYSQINNIIRYINKHTNEIERDLQKLKETYNSIHQNLQTAHPNPHPQSYPYQGNPQANPTPQNLINFYGSYSQPYVYSQTSTHHHPYDPHLYPSHQNPQTAPNPQSYTSPGHPQASANPPTPQNLINSYGSYSQPYVYSQTNTHHHPCDPHLYPFHQNPQTAPNPQSYTSPGHPQASANPPTPQNLPHTLASYQAPQSSYPVSHSTNRCDFPVTPTILTTELNRGTDS